MTTDELIRHAGEILARTARPPAKVILFGSHARGEARPGSDIDFLVIERELRSPREERVRLRMALGGLRTPIDVKVVSERHADEWGSVEGTMLRSALREGRVLAETQG